MRYSEPFSIPERPIGEYYRYINGNPVSGVEGSIPPATAFDEPMAEIQNVIINVGLTPTHDDLTQLWQALVILTARKFITTHITKTVHGAGADFANLNNALLWLDEYTITQTGYVTFMVRPGKWVYTQSVEINHPNSSRIAIQGAALLGGSPQPNNLSVTGYNSSTDGSNQVIYLRSVYATELSFVGGVDGFLVYTAGAVLRYLLITGSQTTSSDELGLHGNGIVQWDDLAIDGIAIWGFGYDGLMINQCTCRMTTSLSLVIAFCGSQGIFIQGGCFSGANIGWVILVSNAISGMTNMGSFAWFDKLCIRGHGPPNGVGGIQAGEGGYIDANAGSDCSYNGAGFLLGGGASLNFTGSTISNNDTFGINATGRSTVYAADCTFGSGQTRSIVVDAAYVDAAGSSLATPTAPEVNTYNTNNDAYINY